MTNTTADRVAGGALPGRLAPGPPLALGLISLAAWAGTLVWALNSGNGPGTMGLGPGAFVAMWSLMMTAMMLPVTIPSVALRYGGTDGTDFSLGGGAIGAFVGGYVLLWVTTGVVAYPAAAGAGHLAVHDPVAARATAVALFAIAGLYEMSDAKRRCLDHCRRYVSGLAGPGASTWQGGVRHAVRCLGCSWALMALFIAVGVMNIVAMVIITVGLFTERHLVGGGRDLRGRRFRLGAGLALIAFGVAVGFFPSLAAGLHAMAQGMAPM
jgi:predicted metal-binding membrane protein